ncbi:MAG: TonB-dependent receptor [Rhodocyclaceae bacterium]|nr:TonB-dependent receptor [Rhodocyclaceae bacterium]
MRHPLPTPTRLATLVAMLGTSPLFAAEPQTLAPVEIIGTTLLPGIGVPKDQVPSNLQQISAPALQAAGGQSTTRALERSVGAITVNEVQGNPFQADLNYRGFTASPLLGTAQGLSVYLDGVRINEPFGDVVNWDLIPRAAIDTITVVPGSNPLYGLNTLGGALSLHTKRGTTHPGTEVELSGGSFGRVNTVLQHGGSADALSWFVAAEGFREDGWRDRSPSEVGQFFGNLSWADERTELGATLMGGSTDLTGNGLLPESMLARDRESIFTHPDNTRNRSVTLAVNGSRWLSDSDQLSGNVYVRRTRARTLNGDGNDDFEDSPFNASCDPDEFDAGSEDQATCLASNANGGSRGDSGVNNRTRTDQNAMGVALQWSRIADNHQYAVGVSHDRSRARFEQTAQEGELNDTRGVDAEGDVELENKLSGRTRTTSLYLTDTMTIGDSLSATASLRYNRTRVINRDQLNFEPPNLDGDFTYHKVNPAFGVSWQAARQLTVYGGFSQGNRAPTPIELGCADPENPCTLPNALAADPFLEQVVARTWEAGVRGTHAGLRWNAGVYRTTNHDDILFVGTSTSAGYFTNFGQTRREGAELGLAGKLGNTLDWKVDYNWLRATFQSSACLLSEANSSRGTAPECTADGQDDEIYVEKGDRLPGMPEHALKLAINWRAAEGLRVGMDIVGYSDQTVRGNENNAHQPGEHTDAFGETRTFSGSGKVAGYAVVNLDAEYDMGGGWTLFGRVDNLFDHAYATAGALAENPFDGSGAFLTDTEAWSDEQFVAPGAPRAAFVGVRYRWGG